MKIIYEYLKQGLRRIEFYTKEDTEKKEPIQTQSKFAKIHQRILNARKKK